jgi:myo-inositol 2-dehydrogenase / D-chiro-inositol 1-dehydrogenase
MNKTKNQTLNHLRYGFIGCGMMGQEHLRNLAMVKGAVAAAIFEPDAAMQKLAASFAPSAVFEESLDALLARTDIDAWVITSPNHCHADQLTAIAAKNPKPTLLEKPACTDLAGIANLQALASAASKGMPIWTAMEYRYMPPITKLIEEAHKAAYTGEPVMFSIREHRYPFLTKVGDWNRFNKNTGGTLVEKCCHFFDLMRHVMQADPIRVYASGGQNHNHLDEQYFDGNHALVPDILDNAYVVLDFPPSPTGNGLPRRALLDLCMFAEGSRYQEELTVVGAKGKLDCKVPGPGRFWPTELGDAPVAQLTVSQRHKTGSEGWTNNPTITAVPLQTLAIPVDPALLAAGDHNGSTFYQHQKFFEMACRFKAGDASAAPEVSLQDGLKAVLIGLAAEQSARSGVAISLQDGDYRL